MDIWATVQPSGFAVAAMAAGPTVPPPPGLFSTTTVWPKYFFVDSAKTLRNISVAPPGDQGQMIVIGFVGKSAAIAVNGKNIEKKINPTKT
jgi:hypothetical protein